LRSTRVVRQASGALQASDETIVSHGAVSRPASTAGSR
jgi:hypothetical protein